MSQNDSRIDADVRIGILPPSSVQAMSSRKYFCRVPPNRLRLRWAALATTVTTPAASVKKVRRLSVSPRSAARTRNAREDRKERRPAIPYRPAGRASTGTPQKRSCILFLPAGLARRWTGGCAAGTLFSQLDLLHLSLFSEGRKQVPVQGADYAPGVPDLQVDFFLGLDAQPVPRIPHDVGGLGSVPTVHDPGQLARFQKQLIGSRHRSAPPWGDHRTRLGRRRGWRRPPPPVSPGPPRLPSPLPSLFHFWSMLMSPEAPDRKAGSPVFDMAFRNASRASFFRSNRRYMLPRSIHPRAWG